MKEGIFWETYAFQYKKKTADWFWAVGIISLAIAIIAAIYSDSLFALFILIVGALLIATGDKKPDLLVIKLNDKGLEINSTLYPFQNIKTFWVEDTKNSVPKLILRIERVINPMMVLPIETDYIEPSVIRDHFLNFVPEDKAVEPFAHKIMEYLGF
ncbi:MAG: hypothetical protein WCV55_03085 [Candidatus Paceibacterota bacterium]